MAEVKQGRGGWRGGGRPKVEGDRHMYTVKDTVHDYIMKHGGGKYLNQLIGAIIAAEEVNK